MGNVYIVGLGMIRFNKYPDRTVRDMAHEVTNLALKDAGLDKAALQAAFFTCYQHRLVQSKFSLMEGYFNTNGL